MEGNVQPIALCFITIRECLHCNLRGTYSACESSEGNTKSPNEREFIVINCAGSNRGIPNRGYELSEHICERIIDKREHVNHLLAC